MLKTCGRVLSTSILHCHPLSPRTPSSDAEAITRDSAFPRRLDFVSARACLEQHLANTRLKDTVGGVPSNGPPLPLTSPRGSPTKKKSPSPAIWIFVWTLFLFLRASQIKENTCSTNCTMTTLSRPKIRKKDSMYIVNRAALFTHYIQAEGAGGQNVCRASARKSQREAQESYMGECLAFYYVSARSQPLRPDSAPSETQQDVHRRCETKYSRQGVNRRCETGWV